MLVYEAIFVSDTKVTDFGEPVTLMIDDHQSREEVAQVRELGIDPATGKPITVRIGGYGPFV